MVRTERDGGAPGPASAGGAPNARLKSRSQATSGATVDLAAALPELLRLLLEPLHKRRGLLGDAVAGGVLAHVLRDLHRAEVRPAHRAEVRELRPLRGQGLVVELARRLRIEREVELVLPAELEARLRERVVPLACARVALREIRGVGGDHDLAVVLPRDRRQLAERLELGELRLVIGVRGRARSQAVAQ